MFNTFFASFFGTQKESQSEDKKLDENELIVDDLENEYSVVRLVEINDDDGIDWLLVEKNDRNTSENEAQKCMALVPWRMQDALPTKMNVTLMEDSWFLTPPECFINLNDGSVRLESSPLENLLIEHPSMSVYCDYKRNISNGNNDLVIIDLNTQQKSITFGRKKSNKKSANSGSQGIPTSVHFVQDCNAILPKCKTNGRTQQGKSAFSRNNKLQLLRHAPIRTTLNQPTARVMINKKK
jgi:hypothetical protein